ncbi:efflux transporter outer membrane subunit [Henriciella marina]|uniref:Efflux transporter outer membrane subunit n=1 Tax=Henriciella marina TaxID=453851 RepID=A0ABT4LUQ3_9PROT|nr:efflux transporter outer membrane subunit [Henriciella marina]MCZ4298107.1 efflux transporter outer membrane subunit [Henriciella marina]
MISTKRMILGAMAATALSGCAMISQSYEQPAAPIPEALPVTDENGERVEPLYWQDVFISEELRELVRLSLAENRDLRIAAANVQLARAQYGISRAQRLPTVTANGGFTEGGTIGDSNGGVGNFDNASASIGITAYELDLFGRVASLNEAALQSYLASAEGERAAKIAIAATVGEIWMQLAADKALLALAEDTVDVQSESLDLTQELFNAGIATELDVRRASASVETARAQAAEFSAQVEQDLNALRLAVGTDLPAGTLAAAKLDPTPLAEDIPIGQSSLVLLSRPDVQSAERQLMAANANIAAARAAFFPIISLTGQVGYSSDELGDLFDGTLGWSFGPSISLPIFDAGARQSNLDVREAQEQLAVASYEQAIQLAFRDTADALAVRRTIDQRVDALVRLVEDTEITRDLSEERFRVGVDDYLSVLDSQQLYYDARQQLIRANLVRSLNSIAVYRALGAWPRDEVEQSDEILTPES